MAMPQSVNAARPRRSIGGWLALVVTLAVLSVLTANLQAIGDWFRLYGYNPSPEVSALATDATFTPQGEHVYFINRPIVTPKDEFAKYCSSDREQTIVLGCYHGVQRGIYILRISPDERLDGVMQVTAAHEMLHAAYDRLSSSERGKINGWLEDFYLTKLTDERVKKTIDAYRQTVPDELTNEMHSIFGSEVMQLTPQLEAYYARYFQDRSKVATYAAAYQGEFTSRQKLVEQYDSQLKQLKSAIETNKQNLEQQGQALAAQSRRLDQLRQSGQTEAYNAGVGPYNAAVGRYNRLATTIKSQIDEYNQLVAIRNAVALEQQVLAKELSGENVSTIPQQ